MFKLFTTATAVLVGGLMTGAVELYAQGPGVASINGTSGGTIKKTTSFVQNATTFLSEGPLTLLTGAEITLNSVPGPDRVLDDWIVTFSGECRLFNSDEINDRLEVRILFDGSDIQGGTDPLTFCSDDNLSTHSVTVIREHVPAGVHTIQVFWQLVDNGVNNPLRGWLDDWTLLLMVTD